MDAPATNIERNAPSRSAPPDWDHVPFDVGCARCGHDLRGLSDPKCPACQLDFDWSDAVPIEHITCETCDYHLCGAQESRCPECGTGFDWNAVLLRYRRMQRPLFEYRWRDEPIRSLVRTWLSLWRPKKFWKSLDLHDPPGVRPLVATWVITMSLCVIFTPMWVGLADFVQWEWWGWRVGGGRPWWLRILDLPGLVMTAARQDELWRMLLPAALWTLISFAALLVFRQSMRRCKVKTAHVVRVWAYAVPQMLPVAVAMCVLGILLENMYWIPSELRGLSLLVVCGVFFMYVTWSLRCAYGHYLRMDRAWAVAIASQIIAVLTLAILGDWITGGQFIVGPSYRVFWWMMSHWMP